MQRMFFHNRHDAASREILKNFDEDVLVYDVFGDDRHNIPNDIHLCVLPYTIDRYISFTPEQFYLVGEPLVLEFKCMDYKNNFLDGVNSTFDVTMCGVRYNTDAVNGIIQIQVECPEEQTIEIQINGFGYLPFKTEVCVRAEN